MENQAPIGDVYVPAPNGIVHRPGILVSSTDQELKFLCVVHDCTETFVTQLK